MFKFYKQNNTKPVIMRCEYNGYTISMISESETTEEKQKGLYKVTHPKSNNIADRGYFSSIEECQRFIVDNYVAVIEDHSLAQSKDWNPWDVEVVSDEESKAA